MHNACSVILSSCCNHDAGLAYGIASNCKNPWNSKLSWNKCNMTFKEQSMIMKGIIPPVKCILFVILHIGNDDMVLVQHVASSYLHNLW